VAGVPHRRSLTAKLFASIGVAGAAASCAGLVTFADPVSARGAVPIRSGRPRLDVLGRVLQPATTVAPGDRISRKLTLRAAGRDFRRLTLSVSAKGASLLTGAHGLRMTISRCPRQWRRGRSRYTCRGKARVILRSAPVLGRRRLKNASLKRDTKLFFLVRLTLPAAADNTFQNQTSTLVFKFTAS
jgi:hypothetical protein